MNETASAIVLPTQKCPPTRKSPKVLNIFGQSKIGKTSMLAQLPDCLNVDMEDGSAFLECMRVNVTSLDDLRKLSDALIVPGAPKYHYIALDPVDSIAEWAEKAVLHRYNHPKDPHLRPNIPAVSIGDIPYGAGYTQTADMVMAIIQTFEELTPRLIVVGHRKRTIIGETKIEFSSTSLDLSGKLRNRICAHADATGYVYRDKQGQLMISFKACEEVEAGSRLDYLKGINIPFEWEKIYID